MKKESNATGASRALPARPNLEHLKSQAKDLLDAYLRREQDALKRLRAALPAARTADDAQLIALNLALHDAQSAIAREYGFASWAELRARVEALDDAQTTPELLQALLERQISLPLPDAVQKVLLEALAETDQAEPAIHAPLPVLAVRNALLTAGSVVPFNVGRGSSIAAVAAAEGGGNTLAVFAQIDEANEAPSQTDLHPVGCVARLLAVIRSADRGIWIVVRALRWIRLEAIEQTTPYLVARVAPFAVEQRATDEVNQLHRELRERVSKLSAALPNPEVAQHMIERLSALELADATVANLTCAVADKARYASEPNLALRLAQALALVERAA